MTSEHREAVSRLEHELGVLIRRARRRMGERAVMVHPQLNASTYLVLVSLVENGTMRAADLAETFSIDKGAISRQIALLEELGFVERTPDPLDGRAQQVALTEAGRGRLAEVHEARSALLDQRLAQWTVGDLDDFNQQLARYNDDAAR